MDIQNLQILMQILTLHVTTGRQTKFQENKGVGGGGGFPVQFQQNWSKNDQIIK